MARTDTRMLKLPKHGATVHRLGLDAELTGANQLIKALEGRRDTLRIRDAGRYQHAGQPQDYKQIWIDTTMTESELDEWCCRVKAATAYVGVWQRRPEQTIEG